MLKTCRTIQPALQYMLLHSALLLTLNYCANAKKEHDVTCSFTQRIVVKWWHVWIHLMIAKLFPLCVQMIAGTGHIVFFLMWDIKVLLWKWFFWYFINTFNDRCKKAGLVDIKTCRVHIWPPPPQGWKCLWCIMTVISDIVECFSATTKKVDT